MTSPPTQPVPWLLAGHATLAREKARTWGWLWYMKGGDRATATALPNAIDGYESARLHDERARAIEAADMEREYAVGKAVKAG